MKCDNCGKEGGKEGLLSGVYFCDECGGGDDPPGHNEAVDAGDPVESAYQNARDMMELGIPPGAVKQMLASDLREALD
jgi:hypothetical protein